MGLGLKFDSLVEIQTYFILSCLVTNLSISLDLFRD